MQSVAFIQVTLRSLRSGRQSIIYDTRSRKKNIYEDVDKVDLLHRCESLSDTYNAAKTHHHCSIVSYYLCKIVFLSQFAIFLISLLKQCYPKSSWIKHDAIKCIV